MREGAERAEQERYKVDNIQRELDGILEETIKTYWLYIWGEYMEGDITPVLSILDDWMRKIEIGGGIIAGVPYVLNDTPYPEIIDMENKWEG